MEYKFTKVSVFRAWRAHYDQYYSNVKSQAALDNVDIKLQQGLKQTLTENSTSPNSPSVLPTPKIGRTN